MSDEAVRAAALAVDRSIILQAPAGSGKTTILTQRFLALLATVEQPEEVMAITFTRKAAAEMRRRISSALNPAPGEDADALSLELGAAVARRSRSLGWALQRNPSRLRILTIDGLNRAIASATPISSVGAGWLPVAQFPQRLHRLAARRCLEEAELDPHLQAHAERVFSRLDNQWSRTESLLADMLARRSQWLPYLVGASSAELRSTIEASLQAFSRRCVERARQSLGEISLREAAALVDYAANNLGGTASVAPEPGNGSREVCDLQRLAKLAFTSTGGWRRVVNKNQGFPAGAKQGPEGEWKARMLAWLQAHDDEASREALSWFRCLPPATLDEASAAVIDSLIALLRYAAAQLELMFLERREIDYVAIAVAARAAVQTPGAESALVIHQGETLRHLLIDEFQDTSNEQFQFIAALLQDWREGDGRSLFLVGDPMQSIYRFREAEVGLFMQAQREGIGALKLHSLSLSRNFRSAQPIIDFVNATFGKMFPAQYDAVEAAIPYLSSECATRESSKIPAEVRCHWIEIESGQAPSVEVDRQVEQVLGIVRDVRSRSVKASIAILVHTRRQARPLVTALHGEGFAVRGVDLLPLAESAVVQDLLALTRAWLWPDDRISALAILRAPWCGLTLQDLHALFGNDRRRTWQELSEDSLRCASLSEQTRLRLDRVKDVFARCHEHAGTSLAQQIERLWLELDGPLLYPSESSLSDARRYLDALELSAGSERPVSREDLEWMLKDLYASNAEEDERAVQVMTVHAAKGLEFDCVILPSLGDAASRDSAAMLDWITWQSGEPQSLLLSPVTSEDSALEALVRRLHHLRQLRERSRVLYVAATRAKASLHLLGAVRRGADGYVPAMANSPLALLWPALSREQRQALQPQPSASPSRTPTVSKTLRRIPSGWQSASWPAAVAFERLGLVSAELAPAAGIAARLKAETYTEAGQADPSARALGIVLHRELEAWHRYARLPGDPQQIVAERGRLEAMLTTEGVLPTELARKSGALLQALARVCESQTGRWILARREGFDEVELQLTGRHEGRILNVVIDRCFIEAGVRWVIDYKSARPATEDVQDFLDTQSERYRAQLDRYRDFAGRLGPEPVKTALYFVFLDRLVELEPIRLED